VITIEKGWLVLLFVIFVISPAVYIETVTAYEDISWFRNLIIDIHHTIRDLTISVHGPHIAAAIAIIVGALIVVLIVQVEGKLRQRSAKS
jgi:hypothetical protein